MDQKYIKLLSHWHACEDAQLWLSEQASVEQAWLECDRGDWLLWLVARLEIDERKLFLAKGKTAKLVIHLMKDNRSIVAVEAAIAYGNGEIDRDKLRYAAIDAAVVYAAHVNDAAGTAVVASADASDAVYTANVAAGVASAAYAAYVAANDFDDGYVASSFTAFAADADAGGIYAGDGIYAAARKKTLQESANITRDIYTLEEVLDAING